jgi:hypothetical protein
VDTICLSLLTILMMTCHFVFISRVIWICFWSWIGIGS